MDIVRLKYRKLEKSAQNVYNWFFVTFGLINLLCYILNIVGAQDTSFLVYYYTNYFVTAAIMMLASGVTFHLQYAMRKYHHFESKRHKIRFALNSFLVIFFSFITFL